MPTEAVGILTPLGDSWGLVHGHAMLGGIAQAEHRFDDAARALERAADESATWASSARPPCTGPRLARVQQRAGDPRAAACYARAIDEAMANGDGRLAATARLNLARLRRNAGDAEGAIALLEENDRWYASAGGGDFALLSHGIFAAMIDDEVGLETVLQQARVAGSVEVQVHALDALARLTASRGDIGPARTMLVEADTLAPRSPTCSTRLIVSTPIRRAGQSPPPVVGSRRRNLDQPRSLENRSGVFGRVAVDEGLSHGHGRVGPGRR